VYEWVCVGVFVHQKMGHVCRCVCVCVYVCVGSCVGVFVGGFMRGCMCGVWGLFVGRLLRV